MGGFGLDITDVLEQLLGEVAEADLAGIRTARLRAVAKKRKRELGQTLEAFDELIARLAEQERRIAAGDLPAPEPEVVDTAEELAAVEPSAAPDSSVAAASEAPHAHAPAPEPEAVDDSEKPTLAEVSAVTPEALGEERVASPVRAKASFHEAPTVVIGSVDDATVDAYTESVRRLEAPRQEAPPPEVLTEPPSPDAVAREVREDFDEMESRGAQRVTDEHQRPSAVVDLAEEEEPTPGWTRPAELLFDDALRLFRLGDSDGALISLERLLTAMDLNEDLREFIRVNEDRLLALYQAILGPWEKVPQRCESPEPMPPAFFSAPKVSHMLDRINGRASLDDLMQDQMLTRLETIAVVSQLLRAKAITTDAIVH